MTGDQDRDRMARLAELEATVRGLTQELVSAEERIRQLEAAVEGAEDTATDGGATKATPDEAKADAEAAPDDDEAEGERSDLDDIIVA